MTKPIYVLNGPNLNRLGDREPEIYGHETLSDIETRLHGLARAGGLEFRQTNHEGELVDWLQSARDDASGVILNAAAYTHTSIATHDALRDFPVPVIEVHISNPAAREDFRHTNYVASAATGTIAGLGTLGYDLALQALYALIDKGPS
ncbi:MAG: type II 3-dehydroquinate dehydratase [Pseudomonadota bacterium]